MKTKDWPRATAAVGHLLTVDAYTSEADANAPVILACDTPIEEITDIEEKIVGTWLIQESYLVGRGGSCRKTAH